MFAGHIKVLGGSHVPHEQDIAQAWLNLWHSLLHLHCTKATLIFLNHGAASFSWIGGGSRLFLRQWMRSEDSFLLRFSPISKNLTRISSNSWYLIDESRLLVFSYGWFFTTTFWFSREKFQYFMINFTFSIYSKSNYKSLAMCAKPLRIILQTST